MSARDMQLEKSEPIPKPKRNSCWIVSCLGLPAAGSQITGVDNQELTAHVDTKPAGSLGIPQWWEHSLHYSYSPEPREE